MLKRIREIYQNWQDYKHHLRKRSERKYKWLHFFETTLYALIAALIIRQWVIQSSVVPTGSMIPTLNIKDRLFVTKFMHHFKPLERGNIVVFKSPEGDGRQFVKRLIGLPGDKVEVKQGDIYINGKLLLLPGVDVNFDYFTGPYAYEVPEGEYFLMGDNRGNSKDSRYWDYHFVPFKNILGEAWFTYYPFNRMRVLR